MTEGYKVELYPFKARGHKKMEWAYRFSYRGKILYHSEGYANKSNARRALTKLCKVMKEMLADFDVEKDTIVVFTELPRNDYRRKVLVED